MNTVNRLLTQHLEIWSAAENEKRSRRGRTSGGENTIYGVRKLRDLILEFAVRGKLVAQVDIDEPVARYAVLEELAQDVRREGLRAAPVGGVPHAGLKALRQCDGGDAHDRAFASPRDGA